MYQIARAYPMEATPFAEQDLQIWQESSVCGMELGFPGRIKRSDPEKEIANMVSSRARCSLRLLHSSNQSDPRNRASLPFAPSSQEPGQGFPVLTHLDAT